MLANFSKPLALIKYQSPDCFGIKMTACFDVSMLEKNELQKENGTFTMKKNV